MSKFAVPARKFKASETKVKKSTKTKSSDTVSEAKKLAAKLKALDSQKKTTEEKVSAPVETSKPKIAASTTNADGLEEVSELTEGEEPQTFAELGVIPPLCEACEALKFSKPTPIQAQAIPWALQGRDIIGLAQTGSGKTAAFALPILQALWHAPAPLFCCVLAPTRELAVQIAEQFEALGAGIGLRCAVIVGGMDMLQQSMMLARKPHVIVATPGRLVDHLENTKGFSLKSLKYLVMDEADRLLEAEFQTVMGRLLTALPKTGRHTYLFSATMTSQVDRLRRASLHNPVKVAVSSKYDTASSLLQYYMFIPMVHKDTYLVYLLQQMEGHTAIVFARTISDAERLALALRELGFRAVPLHGRMNQAARLGALNKFKAGARNILVATDVAARGLDIPSVDIVINYDIPDDSKAYIHRVGRTARAGRSGKSVTFVTQYNLDVYQRLEATLGKKLDEYKVDKSEVMVLSTRVGEALREALLKLRELEAKRSRSSGKNRTRDDGNFEEA
ncbi:uncharacterized protein SAPINGB_P004534 [Magnusiomyces paraingens]|uniref:ATP-dependent rRNA helicase RRP3 n=1 Tax=Magnusiomyces paraingens TaxID=2606893 RepID=A0A5E8BV69_9ASCO|nr:uncharacterized protein SAPINGB_P004534 [Saprochaete ingens]VVT55313.1 unnamed protein product [Saprochaete ingens]